MHCLLNMSSLSTQHRNRWMTSSTRSAALSSLPQDRGSNPNVSSARPASTSSMNVVRNHVALPVRSRDHLANLRLGPLRVVPDEIHVHFCERKHPHVSLTLDYIVIMARKA